MAADEFKKKAARAALTHVQDGMRLGIGSGSTAEAFIALLAERVADGLRIEGVPTSDRTARLCEELGIVLVTLDDHPRLDLTVDGADEIGPELALIKGGGGALLREKIVAAASDRMIVIADSSKHVAMLGRFPLPIEINIFGMGATVRAISDAAAALGLEGLIRLREDKKGPFVTDGGHYVVDASFGRIPDPRALSNALHGIPGVVEHGLFIGLADQAILAGETGITRLHANR
jgi:ribose 5-phosphate isomerase A